MPSPTWQAACQALISASELLQPAQPTTLAYVNFDGALCNPFAAVAWFYPGLLALPGTKMEVPDSLAAQDHDRLSAFLHSQTARAM